MSIPPWLPRSGSHLVPQDFQLCRTKKGGGFRQQKKRGDERESFQGSRETQNQLGFRRPPRRCPPPVPTTLQLSSNQPRRVCPVPGGSALLPQSHGPTPPLSSPALFPLLLFSRKFTPPRSSFRSQPLFTAGWPCPPLFVSPCSCRFCCTASARVQHVCVAALFSWPFLLGVPSLLAADVVAETLCAALLVRGHPCSKILHFTRACSCSSLLCSAAFARQTNPDPLLGLSSRSVEVHLLGRRLQISRGAEALVQLSFLAVD